VKQSLARKFLLYVGLCLPRRWTRFIVDFPGVRQLLRFFFKSKRAQILTPEGYHLSINPIFHCNLLAPNAVSDYEPEVRLALSALTKPGMVCYDIGANIGVFSFLLAQRVGKEGKVYAFEPEINNYTCLMESLKMNAVENLVIETMAVGDITGMVPFDHRGGVFSGRLIDRSSRYKVTRNIEIVTAITLDDYVSQGRGRGPHLIKIDVEGNEFKVLEGMKRLLIDHGPIILCEVHRHLNDAVRPIVPFLQNCGYSLSLLGSAFTEKRLNPSKLENLDNQNRFLARKTF
jgi:FkbM family methyltransferase